MLVESYLIVRPKTFWQRINTFQHGGIQNELEILILVFHKERHQSKQVQQRIIQLPKVQINFKQTL
jgi:hypothetical protein